MAGLTSSPEMRGQLAAIARVRWQLFVNGLRTIRGRLEVVARGIVFLMLTVAGLGGSFALGAAALLLLTYFGFGTHLLFR